MSDIFSFMRENTLKKESPLAVRMRPKTLEDIVGQEHILGKGKMLYRAIAADQLHSLVLYGPPGTGKTTVAQVIAGTTSAAFVRLNATTAGKKDMQEAVETAQSNLGMYGKKTILFIDEIHRFNKAQQDYLLPFVEDGTVILIGATTENPYFEVNSALLSRSMVFELKPLTEENIKTLLRRCITDRENGLGVYNAVLEEEALAFLAAKAGGDARSALNALELGVLTTPVSDDGKIHITLAVAEECIQKRALRYDKKGSNHYDVISAFIKSMRGSDPDAAVYYLARMIEAGEDPAFIARRMMICASEDVGNADPQALCVAVSAAQAAERVGWPEARIILAQAAVYIATAPKSNASYLAIAGAQAEVEKSGSLPVPVHLQNNHCFGEGETERPAYQYAHDFKNHYVKQQYLPDGVRDRQFYTPTENGYEQRISQWMQKIKQEA